MSDKVLTLSDAEQDLEESLTAEEEENSDDEGLNTKLCSFTVTQKTFIHQYWCAGHLPCAHVCVAMYLCLCVLASLWSPLQVSLLHVWPSREHWCVLHLC